MIVNLTQYWSCESMDVLNYNLEKEIFENNLGVFYTATKKEGGNCVVLKINKTLKDEKFLAQVAEFAKSEKKPVTNAFLIKDFQKDGDEYYAEYEYFDGKPISFIMSYKRKSSEVKDMIKSVAVTLDSFAEAGMSYGGLTTESVIKTDKGYYIVGVEFYNTEYKLVDNLDLYAPGYVDPKVEDGKYTQKSDIYSLGRFTGTIFLAEKFYTAADYPIPSISFLKPIQKSIDKATKTEEKFESCTAFAESLVDFKGTCPFTDHGSQYATYAYVVVVIILIIVDFVFNLHGKVLGG